MDTYLLLWRISLALFLAVSITVVFLVLSGIIFGSEESERDDVPEEDA
jgi:hypothetical protein